VFTTRPSDAPRRERRAVARGPRARGCAPT
jgi:hypothetical protein